MKKFIKYMFTPRTDSPTKAYYVGLASGLIIYHTMKQLVDDEF